MMTVRNGFQGRMASAEKEVKVQLDSEEVVCRVGQSGAGRKRWVH